MFRLLVLVLLFTSFAFGSHKPQKHTATLSWADPDPVVFRVYRRTGTSGYSIINLYPVTALSYVDANVTNGQTYCYVVTAINVTDQESSYSNEVCATIPKK